MLFVILTIDWSRIYFEFGVHLERGRGRAREHAAAFAAANFELLVRYQEAWVFCKHAVEAATAAGSDCMNV